MDDRKVLFTLTQRDVVTAMQLASARKIFVPIPLLLAIGAATAVVAHLVFGNDGSFAADYLVPFLVLMMIVVVLIQYVVLPWQARNHYRQSASFSDQITVGWDDNGVILSGAHGESKIAWTELHRWSEGPSVLLIYHSDIMFHAIPKSALEAGQLADFIEQLNRSGVKKR